MDKNIENFINEKKIEVDEEDIFKKIILFLILAGFAGLITSCVKEFIILGGLYIGSISILGFYYMKKRCDWGLSIYSGLEGLSFAALLLVLSYICLNQCSQKSIFVLVLYIAIYLMSSIYFLLHARRRINRDTYGKKTKNKDAGNLSAIICIGTVAGMSISPIIFSDFSNHQAYGFLALVFLVFGALLTMSSVNLLVAYMQKKYLER